MSPSPTHDQEPTEETPAWATEWASVRKAVHRLNALQIDRRDAMVVEVSRYVMDAFEQMNTAYESLNRRLRAAEEKYQWRSIETAPKVGDYSQESTFIYAEPNRHAYGKWLVGIAYRSKGGSVLNEFGGSVRATHWMPLPAPPTAELARTKETAE